MTVSFFEKGQGFETLRDLYHLSEDDIEWIEENLFDYEIELTTREQADDCIRTMRETMPEESEESLEQTRRFMLDRSRLKRWPKDDADELFVERFGAIDMFSVDFTLRHIASVIDGGESINEKGLVRLTDLLKMESPLSCFLRENGIEINVTERQIRIKGNLHSLDEDRFGGLRGKLYYFNGEIEAFISGNLDKHKGYSCIQDAPEFLLSLDNTCFDGEQVLEERWKAIKSNTICVEFDMKPSEFTLSHNPSANNEYWNDWVISMCLESMCNNLDIKERYVALHGNVEPNRLRIRNC